SGATSSSSSCPAPTWPGRSSWRSGSTPVWRDWRSTCRGRTGGDPGACPCGRAFAPPRGGRTSPPGRCWPAPTPPSSAPRPPDARQAVAESEDGSLDAICRSFLRKGLLTSWQVDRLKKGDPSGFFYGGCKVLFHLAEGTFARVYRGVKPETGSPVAIKVLRNR